MICRKCQAAAEVGQSIPHYGKLTMAFKNDTSVYICDVFEKVARLLHSECRGKTHCDCQHKPAGNGINYVELAKIAAENEEIRRGLDENDESTTSEVREDSSGYRGQEQHDPRGIAGV